MKRNGSGNGNGHGDGPHVSTGDAPRDRARYITGKPAANDTPAFTLLTAEQLAAIVRDAVTVALDERDTRQGAVVATGWLDRNGLADALGCSASQVDKCRGRGMPCVRLGESPRFELKACIEWLRVQKGGAQ